MNKHLLLLAVAPIALATPAMAEDAVKNDGPAVHKVEQQAPAKEVFSTGVAKGRDVLDSAISTSSLKSEEIAKFGARSLGEALRNIPGVRVEYQGGEGNANISIRGLPLLAAGSKYLQLEEDGLPVLEFGDILQMSSDTLLRVDSNLAQIEAIRGGSASTFASNSPGGVINLISKTGEEEGGSIAGSFGIGYSNYRLDFDYGGRINDTLRYHVGGFYRQGEGPRDLGYDAYKGGQFKFNITKELSNGFIRLYGKYLDDRTPWYFPVPTRVTGTNANPKFGDVPNFDIGRDSLLSRNITSFPLLDQNNNLKVVDAHEGMHPIMKSIGLETKFDVAEWTISDKFRFADISGNSYQGLSLDVGPAADYAMRFGGPGATLSYANGPHTGQVIDPATLNGNGLMTMSVFSNTAINSMDNVTNDLRASRVWDVGEGKLTTTVGFYKSRQSLDTFWTSAMALHDVASGGNSALINVTTAGGFPVMQDGILFYGVGGTGAFQRHYNVNYDVNAPFASANYQIGKLAIGGSVRYDKGKVSGTLIGSDLGGGRLGVRPYDINGDGVISFNESLTASLPLTRPGIVDYGYHYVSYSAGVNYRIAEPLAVFARYSRGGRAAADRSLYRPVINYDSGALIDPKDGYDTVRQAEAGVKYRNNGLALNLTGFLANTGERNVQINSAPDGTITEERVFRKYRAYGAEFEGSVRHGPFSLTAGATFTHAKIVGDVTHPEFVGNTPRHQAQFIFEAMPQYETRMFTVGANIVGTTSSYAQDTNQLKMPGYTVVHAFVQFRPTDHLELMLNANNLFDTRGIADVAQGSMPANGIALTRSIAGRTVSGTARFTF